MMDQTDEKKHKPIWRKFLSGCLVPILLIALALLGLGVYLSGWNPYGGPCVNEKGFFSRLTCGISVVYDDIAPYFRSLPSDDEMIANFNKHRSDFQRLVQIYRQDLSVPADSIGYLEPTPKVKRIMNRIHVSYVRGDNQSWIPPNPYSRDPVFLEKQRGIRTYSSEARAFSGVVLAYDHGEVQGKFGPEYKGYWFIPVIPEISNGIIMTPFGSLTYLVDTSDDYPPDLGPYRCACRRIEPHWFIKLCNHGD